MKDKVAKAIKDRGAAVVNNAASQLRTEISRFFDKTIGYSGSDALKIELLRGLADYLDGTAKKWTIPALVWEKAESRAYDEFMNQFDALTRFVNKDIPTVDANCEPPEGLPY